MAKGNDSEARTFMVESRFQKLARRPGGVSRDTAIEKAQASIEQARPSFADWLDPEIRQLIALVRQAPSQGSDDSKRLEEALACCRRMRDIGTTMGFELITFVAKNLCEIFEAIAAGAEHRQDLIDCHIEALLLARQDRYRNMRPEQLPELSTGLRRVVERAGTARDPG